MGYYMLVHVLFLLLSISGIYWPGLFWFSTNKHFDNYWTQIRQQFYRPKEAYTPVIVVHIGYSWDGFALRCLNSLLRQGPADFVKRVVLASLDGSSIPKQSRDLLANDRSSRPLLVSLPYPVSVLNASSWFPLPGIKTTSADSYRAPSRRPISVLFMGQFKNAHAISQLRLALEHVFKSSNNTRANVNANKVNQVLSSL